MSRIFKYLTIIILIVIFFILIYELFFKSKSESFSKYIYWYPSAKHNAADYEKWKQYGHYQT